MKLERLPTEKAKHIIVYGEDKGFSVFVFKGEFYNVYHRKYEDRIYDIVEITVYDKTTNKDISVYDLLDHKEAVELLRLKEGDYNDRKTNI